MAHVQKILRGCLLEILYISNIFTFENDNSDLDSHNLVLSLKRLKSFGHLSNHLNKTRLRSHHSDKTEFLGQIQKKKPTFVIGDSNQPSRVKTTLTGSRKGLVRLSPISSLDKQCICINTQLKSSKKQLKLNVCVPKSNSVDRYAITCNVIAYHSVHFVSICVIYKCQSGIDFFFTSERTV